jgi:uncharacterized membrane protein YkoI
MRRRFLLAVAVTALFVLVGATFAFGGALGLIWDDGHYAKPGSLDDGKELLSQTKITLPQAVAAARKAQSGQLGQVDLEHYGGRIVYMVDVGSNEVRVDATDGSIAAISPHD